MNLFGKPFSLANKSHVISLVVFVFLLLAIPITVYNVLTSREPASKASTAGLHPNDPCYSTGCVNDASLKQWSLALVKAPNSWEVSQGSSTIKVAVISTGVSANSPQDNFNELSSQVVTGYNTYDDSTNTNDDFGGYGIGTLDAGIIGAKSNNSFGMAGIAWNVSIAPVKVCDFGGTCPISNFVEGINWASANGAKLIHISVAHRDVTNTADQDAIRNAIANAQSKGIIVIGAVGNVPTNPGFLASVPNVIAVGATDKNNVISSFSARTSNVDLVAPGEAVVTIVRGGCCLSKSGTELAASHVTGAAALMLSAGVPAAQIPNALFQTATDLGPGGKDNDYGYGLLNICAALNYAGKTCPTPDPVPVANILANNQDASISIPYNTSATISWTSTNATSCSVAPTGWTGLSGSQSTGNLTTSRTYTLSCSGAGVSVTDSVVVNVLAQGDTTKPTVSITTPDNGQWVKGIVTISANASDNIGVTKVEFYLDNSLSPMATDTTAPYSTIWDTTFGSSGNHSITAKAFDAAGNNQTATAFTVFVDNQPPTVDITSPANGATVSGTVNITANATDNLGIVNVELFVNGVPKGEDFTSPYSIPWNTVLETNGNYLVEIRAVDNLLNIGLHTISVVVQNGDTVKPTIPVLSLTSSGTSVNLTWTASTDNVAVTGYYVYRNGSLIAQKDAASRTLTDNPPCGTNLTYTIRAFDAAGNVSDPSTGQSITLSCPDTQAPTAPTNLTATAVSTSQINLTWTASTDNLRVSGYEIYRNGNKIATIDAVTSFGDTGLTAATTYNYYVKAFDGASPANISAASNTATATTQSPPLTNGSVTGVVSSSNGGVLSGAKVSTTVAGVKRTVVTNSAGQYFLTNMPATFYSLKYSAKQHVGQTHLVTVPAGSVVTKNVSLERR